MVCVLFVSFFFSEVWEEFRYYGPEVSKEKGNRPPILALLIRYGVHMRGKMDPKASSHNHAWLYQ